jgi:hypothetical protein
MNINIFTKNQIKQIVKEEINKKEFQMQRLINILYKKVQKLEEELKIKKFK